MMAETKEEKRTEKDEKPPSFWETEKLFIKLCSGNLFSRTFGGILKTTLKHTGRCCFCVK
jgi:hypothetical protein